MEASTEQSPEHTEPGNAPLASVILPAYNEAEALPQVLDDLALHLDPWVEIVVVDDGSSDETLAIARDRGVATAVHSQNRGKGAAMSTGAASARGDLLIFMDADATYPADAIPEVIRLLADHDYVRAERPLDSPNIPSLNRIGNSAFNRVLSSFHQLEGNDVMSGLYGLRREAFESLALESTGFDIEVEIGIRARQQGLSLATFDIPYHQRLGEKKLRPVADGLNILMRIAGMALLYSPTITFVIPGLLIMVLGLIGALTLSGGPLIIGEIGLSVNSFVLASLGVLGGFQLVVFGIAATLYRAETGVEPRKWLLKLGHRPVRLGAAVVGVVLAAAGTIWLLILVVGWIAAGAGDFLETEALVLAATIFVFGLQLMSAGLFLSIFSGRLAARNG